MTNWMSRFLDTARFFAAWSKDPRTHVGAVAVGQSNEIIATGYNGLPRGVRDLPERMLPPQKYDWGIHAEANLVANAARPALQGKTVFITHAPCAQCAGLLIQAGVSRIVYGDGTTNMAPEKFDIARVKCCEAGVELTGPIDVNLQGA